MRPQGSIGLKAFTILIGAVSAFGLNSAVAEQVPEIYGEFRRGVIAGVVSSYFCYKERLSEDQATEYWTLLAQGLDIKEEEWNNRVIIDLATYIKSRMRDNFGAKCHHSEGLGEEEVSNIVQKAMAEWFKLNPEGRSLFPDTYSRLGI